MDLKENGLGGDFAWYADFVQNLSFDDLYELFEATNCYEFKVLLDLTSAAVAAHFKMAEEKNGL